MIRNALIIAGASFVLMLGCFAGVAALAGPTIMKEGWTIPFDEDADFDVKVGGSSHHVTVKGSTPSPTVSREFAWSGGDFLKLDVPSNVEFIQGPVGKIEVTGPKSMVDRLTIEGGSIHVADNIEGESLTIDRHGIRVQSGSDRLRIVVTAPGVRRFELSGSGDLEIQGFNQSSLSVTIDGSGDVSANGRVDTVEVKTNGSGSAYLEDLKTKDANVAILGSGGVEISPSDKVKIDITGSGDVSLESEATSVVSNVTGSGSVRHSY
ncbi:GIN domain-containing protein [Caulobacter sp. DWR1-3-2b1]|uniref:GIN domain-containing protein n=1 Tax=Caulobacter sp. DWR1-3-2b1 TaxID=2804670 RepID=UPI003CFB8383